MSVPNSFYYKRRMGLAYQLGFAKKTCLMKLEVYFVMPFYVLLFKKKKNFVESDMLNQV